ncbi:MAG: tRNA (N6-isopentenyl adenosine(37)-C2)-methylthiotransferase MiaB [Fibrobacterota bacterium]
MQYFIKTFGCQMNVADSQSMARLLQSCGARESADSSAADLIIVNTCSVREKAESTAKSKIREYAAHKKKKADLWVVGCMSERIGDALIDEIPGITRVIGAVDVEFIDTHINAYCGGISQGEAPRVSSHDVTCFIPVMRGCNNFCSYCIVPFVRGREHSVRRDDILSSVRRRVAQGVREVTFLGQNVNSYRDGDTDFAALLRETARIPGLDRLRFTTSHPKDISESLMETVADCDTVVNHIHLPVQAGSDRVLQRMNRKYTVDQYLRSIDRIRALAPGIDITTDVMVGFPGESAEDFEETLKLFRRVGYTAAFMFAFSPRPGTPAAEYSDQVDENIRRERLNQLIQLQTEITREKYSAMVGTEVQALMTFRNKRGGWLGQNNGAMRVLVNSGEDLSGKMIRGRVSASSGMTLIVDEVTLIGQ